MRKYEQRGCRSWGTEVVSLREVSEARGFCEALQMAPERPKPQPTLRKTRRRRFWLEGARQFVKLKGRLSDP
jgi:hypothetical protein